MQPPARAALSASPVSGQRSSGGCFINAAPRPAVATPSLADSGDGRGGLRHSMQLCRKSSDLNCRPNYRPVPVGLLHMMKTFAHLLLAMAGFIVLAAACLATLLVD